MSTIPLTPGINSGLTEGISLVTSANHVHHSTGNTRVNYPYYSITKAWKPTQQLCQHMTTLIPWLQHCNIYTWVNYYTTMRTQLTQKVRTTLKCHGCITGGCKSNDFTIGGSPALQLHIRDILHEFTNVFSYNVKGKAMAVPPMTFTVKSALLRFETL